MLCKYLGYIVSSNASSDANSQASSAFHMLVPVLTHRDLSPTRLSPKSSSPFYSTPPMLKFIHPPNLPMSTLCTSKLSAKFLASKAPTFTGSCRPLRLTAPTLTLFLSLITILPACSCPIKSSLLADSDIWVIFYATLTALNTTFRSMILVLSAPFPPRCAARAHWPELAISEASHRLCLLHVHQTRATTSSPFLQHCHPCDC